MCTEVILYEDNLEDHTLRVYEYAVAYINKLPLIESLIPISFV